MCKATDSEIEKIKALFSYLKDVNGLKNQDINTLDNQIWSLPFANIDENKDVTICFRDRLDEEGSLLETPILSVHRPKLERCPEPDIIFLKWLENGWDDCNSEVKLKKQIIPIAKKESIDESNLFGKVNSIEETFESNKNRVNKYHEWLEKQQVWAKQRSEDNKTYDLFQNLYQRYMILKNNSENLELMIGNGIFSMVNSHAKNHPLFLRHVELRHQSDANTMMICDKDDAENELYTSWLSDIEDNDFNLPFASEFVETIKDITYHPLNRPTTKEFLNNLINGLSPTRGAFYKSIDTSKDINNKYIITDNPVVFIRKKRDGLPEFVDKLLQEIDKQALYQMLSEILLEKLIL